MKIMGSTEPITRESVLKLMEEKDEIEAQLRAQQQILDGNNIGMSEPLVDREGYPRSDIDVYQVRQARHKIICLQNDHKQKMSEIEKGIHFLHSQSVGRASITEGTSQEKERKPFAKIVHVDVSSPAYQAGLQVGDMVLSFGTVNIDNFKSMQDVASIVQHSVGCNVVVTVRRSSYTKKLTLVPHEWKGKGLLGCVIIGLENVER